MTRLCVFISGRGSNLAAAIEACSEYGDTAKVQIVLVVSSDRSAAGLAKARRAGIATYVAPRVFDRKLGKEKIDWDELSMKLQSLHVDMIFLLGFMRIVPAGFLTTWKSKVINLHPSLLPRYPGLNSIERAFLDSSDMGVTVHSVVPEVDRGPIIRQKTSLKGQTLAESEFNVHILEQVLVKKTILIGTHLKGSSEVGAEWR